MDGRLRPARDAPRPIIIRVVYELLMLSLLLVQNVISINRKLRNQNDEDGKEADIFASPDLSGFKAKFRKQQTSNPNAGARFCFRCGAPLDPMATARTAMPTAAAEPHDAVVRQQSERLISEL